MHAVLYQFDWQKLRVSCLARYDPKGGWTTPEGVKDNLIRMREYLHPENFGSEAFLSETGLETESSIRTYRVNNLINATRMGYSGNRRNTSNRLVEDLDELLLKFRAELNAVPYNKEHVTIAGINWDWQAIERNIDKGYRWEPGWFNAVYENLSYRESQARRTRDPRRSRNELMRFLDLMSAVKVRYEKP